MDKYTFTYNEYLDVIETIISKVKDKPRLHLVGVYRGSLPIVIHLSNRMDNTPVSIIRFQVRDGNDTKPTWLLNEIKSDDDVVVVDDIYRSGATFRGIKNVMTKYKKVKYISIYGSPNNDDVEYILHHHDRWILFPWDVSKEMLNDTGNIPDYWKEK